MEPETKSAMTSYSPEHSGGGAEGKHRPPAALREPVEHVIHGDRRIDHYAWLRKKDDPRVVEYLKEENAYAETHMKSTETFQEELYQEMLGRILQTDLSVPYLLRGYSYYSRTEEGKQYPIYCRRKEERPTSGDQQLVREDPRAQTGVSVPQEEESASWSEEVLLDLNALAEGHSFLGLGIFEVSDDNQLLAYATDTTGFRQYTLEVKDLRTGELLPFRVERVTSVAWSRDNRTLFYVVEDEVTKRSHQLWRHWIEGRPGSSDQQSREENPRAQTGVSVPQDELVYEEKDERFRIDIERTRSGAYLLLVSNSHTTSEIRYLRADEPFGEYRRIAEREDGHEYYVDHHPGSAKDPAGGVFFIRTNSGGRTYRLMTAPVNEPGRKSWHEVIPNRPEVMLAGMEAFRTHLVMYEREGGLPYLRVVDLTRAASTALEASYRIEFAEPAYNATFGANPEFDTGHLRFHYESFITPRSVYDYDLKNGERILRKQQPVLGGYDRNGVWKRTAACGGEGWDKSAAVGGVPARYAQGRECTAAAVWVWELWIVDASGVQFEPVEPAEPRSDLCDCAYSRRRRVGKAMARCGAHAPENEYVHGLYSGGRVSDREGDTRRRRN